MKSNKILTIKDQIGYVASIYGSDDHAELADICKSKDCEPMTVVELEDLQDTLNNFLIDYWRESHEGDKYKQYISCDDLDYLVNKHFGAIIDIKTLQELENPFPVPAECDYSNLDGKCKNCHDKKENE